MAKDKITVIVLTSSGKDGSDTVSKIGISAKKYGCKFYMVSTQYAYIDDRSATHESITINNYDGTGKSITLDPRDVVCFSRGGVTNTQIGLAILSIFEKTGMFIVNERRPMELCANKLYTAIQLDKHKIPAPRTAFVSNLGALDDALKKIGGKFPIIVKTLTGAEGVGVSIIDSYESLKSVLQTLWKYKAELIIQEYLEIKNDVRVLVLDGKVVAAAMRGKAPKDFRTNLAQGAEGGPYELSDQERDVAERAAKAFGTYYVGVDMVLSKGKPYVIELNSSPGSGNIYRSYFADSEGKAITGQKLIDSVVRYSIDRDNWHHNHREAGLIEPIKIHDIDSFQAKMDTGNESYNVLGAENIEEYNGMVHFIVNGKKYTKPIVSHVRIRTNNINADRRPVVEFDVEFRNRTFRNVRFSLVPRRFNKYPVLIGNKFMSLAKVSVNINKKQTLPENYNENVYIQKMMLLQSYVEIEEFRETLREKMNVSCDTKTASQIQEALEYIDIAKYELKNNINSRYDRSAIMHADKKFAQFLENISQKALSQETLNVLNEAKGQMQFGFMKKPKSKTAGGKKAKKAKKPTFKSFRAGVRKWVENNQDSLSDSATRLVSYDSTAAGRRHQTENGIAIQTGENASVVDGNWLGRMWRYAKSKGINPWKYTIGKLRNMTSGVKPEKELQAGRGKGKWKLPHYNNPSLKKKAATFARRSQGKLFGSQTKEFRGSQPSRMTHHGRVAMSKTTRDRKTGEKRENLSRLRSIARIKRERAAKRKGNKP